MKSALKKIFAIRQTYQKATKTSPSSITYGREILRSEGEAVQALAELLDERFDQAVEAILQMSSDGHVIVSGIGKAGFVGMKISATLASIGVPSFFLHPAEALHGDLGRYTKKDLALILSNSGNTEEILKIIPQIKQIGCPVIVITSDGSSVLASQSEITLLIGSITEAGPLGLAPTTSTTVMLALCDALAMSVLKQQGISKEQFACFHPGGSLGKSLMPVSALMRREDEHCIVSETMVTREVLHKVTGTKGRPGAASVIDRKGKLVGIFTDGNLRRCLDQKGDFLDLPISQVMGRNPKVVTQDKLVTDALNVLGEYRIDQVIVVNSEHEPVGMIDVQDVLEVS